MKTIGVQQDVLDYLVSKANTPGEPPASVLRRELKVPQPDPDAEGPIVDHQLGPQAVLWIRVDPRV